MDGKFYVFLSIGFIVALIMHTIFAAVLEHGASQDPQELSLVFWGFDHA